MVAIWGPMEKVIMERKLWVTVLKAQDALGIVGRQIPDGAIRAYEKNIANVDLEQIRVRELETRQDVTARIAEFNSLAGYECVHLGMTSRDQTDNTEQCQILASLKIVRDKTVAILSRFAAKALQFKLRNMCGRTHNVPAQTIRLRKRFANFAEELLIAFERLEHLIEVYPLRGIKGATGTQQDMLDLLGSPEMVKRLEEIVAEELGFRRVLESVGQVYPRSLDYEVLSVLTQLASAPGNFAKMVRLMAGIELAHEGFKEGQDGSSAMPHKMNSRTCERINGLVHVLGGFGEMTKALIGDQWYEGDVSCSVIRRVALPGAFFALDGIYESLMTVLDEMEVFYVMVERELERYLPFVSSTRLLTAVVKKGMDREKARKIIKKHATSAIRSMRGGGDNCFAEDLARDEDFPLDGGEIETLLATPKTGLAEEQVDAVCAKVCVLVRRYPEAEVCNPEPLL